MLTNKLRGVDCSILKQIYNKIEYLCVILNQMTNIIWLRVANCEKKLVYLNFFLYGQ